VMEKTEHVFILGSLDWTAANSLNVYNFFLLENP
jgi:hypothetical protein